MQKRLKKIQLGTEINVDIKNNIGMLDNIEGNSYQATREGYNLARYNTKVNKNIVNFDIGDIKKQQDYTLYLYIPIGTIGFNLKNKNDATTILTDWNKTGKVIKTFTASQDDILYFNGFGSSTDYNGITEIMLLKGTYTLDNLPTFEEYGIMPSLDYPSEVEAVGDNINLFDKDNPNKTDNIGIGGTEGSLFERNDMCFYALEVIGKTYLTISFNKINTGTRYCAFSNEIPTSISETVYDNTLISNSTGNISKTITNNGYKYLLISLTKRDLIDTLKVEEGTAVTSYSPHNQGSIEIVHSNKNFLNFPDRNVTQNGVTIQVTNGNHFKITGTQTGTVNYVLFSSDYFENINNIAYNKYPVTISRSTKEYLPFELNFASDKSNWYMQIARNTTKVTKNILNEKINRLALYIGFSSTKEINSEFDLQLELSNTESKIIKPQGNTYILPIQKPFHKIGKYNDGFVRLGNQWYEQHYIKEYIFTGTETYTKSTQYSNDNWLCAYLLNESRVMDVKYAAPMYATRFKKIGLYSDILDENCIFSSTQFHVRVSTNYLTENTTEAYSNLLKQWYDEGNPLKVYYISDEPELVKCTERQNSILNDLSNIQLYNGINYIYTNAELGPTLKFLYYDKYEKDDDVYVFDKDENLIAVFDKDDEDTIINPQVHDLQNTESTFSFSLPLNSAKWQQINNAENLYYTDNKMFSTNFDGCFTSDVNENNEDLVSIIAYERQKLLERMYVRAWNSEDGFENVDTFMCVILSKGNLELKNNGELVNSTHLKGTSGYVLDGLLYGTGWTTGVCDVEGEFDFETDQVDIFNNILKVQEIWGGILVIDSVNKIIEHRDETKFLPYDGFEVRYQKNMQSLEKIYNNKIITELCPLGEGGLNIKSVNGGSEWITNYTYSSSRLQGIENNADITDPVQLKKWGERKLKDLCKPSKELNVKAILLNQIEGFEHEVIGLNDIVDVIDYQFIVGDIEQLRVVEYTHKIWDNSDAEIVLSDITLDSTDIFKKTVSATDTINNGTLTTNKVVDFFKNGQSLHQTLTQIGNTIEQNKSDLIKTDEEIQATITNVKTVVDDLNHTILSQQEIIENLEITIEGLKNQLTISGGNNLIRNSVGIFGNEYWEGSVIGYTDTDIQQNNVSKNAIYLQNGSIMQELLRIKNGFYNISFNYKKLLESAVCKVKINDNIEIDLDNTSWDSIDKQLEILDNYFRIEFISDSNNACYISDLILIVGKNKQTWTQNINETISETVSIGQGIRVDSDKTNTYTRIDSDGNRTFNKATNQAIMEATDKGINAENAIVRTQAEITGVLQQKVGDQVWGALL